MKTEEMLKVMQASLEGKKIQFAKKKYLGTPGFIWNEVGDLSWNWKDNVYRVKPEPYERWLTVNKDDYDLVGGVFYTEAQARSATKNRSNVEIIHVREVIEE